MNAVVEVTGLSKRFKDVVALDDVHLTLHEHAIHGLLGRNGAGKTTLMQLLTGQDFPPAGTVRVFGRHPVENADVLRRICFIKESQKYPESFTAKHVLRSASWLYEQWDQGFADQLVEDFRLPLNREVKKLSRGQLSAVGVIVGLAARAPLTFFDEPYLGLDAVARQLFYDRLLEDYAEHPRTIVLSTHLIDEVANLLERVILIDQGRILIDDEAENARRAATTVAGRADAVDGFVAGRDVLHRSRLGGLSAVTVRGELSDEDRGIAARAGLDLSPVSLQELVVRSTSGADRKEVA